MSYVPLPGAHITVNVLGVAKLSVQAQVSTFVLGTDTMSYCNHTPANMESELSTL